MAHALSEHAFEPAPAVPASRHANAGHRAGADYAADYANAGRAAAAAADYAAADYSSAHRAFDGTPDRAPASAIPLAGRHTELFRPLGQTGLQVYPLALGTSVFGWTADGQASRDILDRYFEFGGNFIDTADSYTAGRSEVIIGGWMRDRRNRDQFVLATKVGRHPDHSGLAPSSIVRATEESLKRLRTDHIDVLFFHGDDQEARFEDSLATADALIDAGKVRHLAASDYSAARLMEARILSAYGLGRFAAIQTEYSLMRRQFEGDLSVISQGQGLGVMPYFALANGFLTGKYLTRHQKVSTTRQARAMQHVTRKGLRTIAALKLIAAEHETSPATIALAWLLAKPGVTAPVTSASHAGQVDALMAAPGIRMSRSQVLELDRVSS